MEPQEISRSKSSADRKAGSPVDSRRLDRSDRRPAPLLADRYRLGEVLGRGATGTVHAAEDTLLGVPVAVKLLHPELLADPLARTRARREARLARRIRHPHVCCLYDLLLLPGSEGPGAGGGDGSPGPPRIALVLEWLVGETLAERLERRGRLTPEEALPLVRQLAEGLAAAHRAGVVHRDLKTSNLQVVWDPDTEAERLVITDFGLARGVGAEVGSSGGGTGTGGPRGAATEAGTLVGSPAYMAPEQVRGEPATPAVDVYALGVVLFELVTGSLPFQGETAFETALARLAGPPPSPRAQVPELPQAWERVILRCLAVDPDERFADPREAVAALQGAGPGRAHRPGADPDEPSRRALPGLLRAFRPRLPGARSEARSLAALLLAGLLVLALHLGGVGAPAPEAGSSPAVSAGGGFPVPAGSAGRAEPEGEPEAPSRQALEAELRQAEAAGDWRRASEAARGAGTAAAGEGDLEAGSRLWARAFELAGRAGDPLLQAKAKIQLGSGALASGSLEPALAHWDAAEALLERGEGLDEPVEERIDRLRTAAALAHNRAVLEVRRGRTRQAVDHFERVVELRRRTHRVAGAVEAAEGQPGARGEDEHRALLLTSGRELVAALDTLADRRLLGEDPVGARLAYREAEGLARRLGEADLELSALAGVGVSLAQENDHRQARRVLAEALSLARRRFLETGGEAHRRAGLALAGLANNLAEVEVEAGHLSGAETHYREAARLYGELEHPERRRAPLRNLAHLLWRQGYLEEAEARLREALAAPPEGSGPQPAGWEAETRLELARLVHDRGRSEEAGRALAEAHRLAGATGDRGLMARLLEGEARLLLDPVEPAEGPEAPAEGPRTATLTAAARLLDRAGELRRLDEQGARVTTAEGAPAAAPTPRDRRGAAEHRLLSAELAALEGRESVALEHLAEARLGLAESFAGPETRAREALAAARVHRRLGRLAAARALLDDLEGERLLTEDRRLRLAWVLERGRWDRAAGGAGGAVEASRARSGEGLGQGSRRGAPRSPAAVPRAELEGAAAEAERLGFVPLGEGLRRALGVEPGGELGGAPPRRAEGQPPEGSPSRYRLASMP